MTRYKYSHPQELGFGAHHANPGDPPLHERPAQPPEAAAALRGALAMVSPTPEQTAELEAFLTRTMHDLDMHHGTEVEHYGHDDDRNLELVSWTDQHGDERNTSVTPEFFAAHFQAVS